MESSTLDIYVILPIGNNIKVWDSIWNYIGFRLLTPCLSKLILVITHSCYLYFVYNVISVRGYAWNAARASGVLGHYLSRFETNDNVGAH